MTITTPREQILAFSTPYYYTPAQMAASTASGITTYDGLAGKTICVVRRRPTFDWPERPARPRLRHSLIKAQPPAGAKVDDARHRPSLRETIKAGRKEFEGWLSSSTTVDQAITEGLPLVRDRRTGSTTSRSASPSTRAAPTRPAWSEAVNKILADMRADGTLKAFSEKVVRHRPHGRTGELTPTIC